MNGILLWMENVPFSFKYLIISTRSCLCIYNIGFPTKSTASSNNSSIFLLDFRPFLLFHCQSVHQLELILLLHYVTFAYWYNHNKFLTQNDTSLLLCEK